MNILEQQEQLRHSGIELLRIIAMLLVVVVHTDFWSLGWPKYDFIQSCPNKAFVQILIESFSIVCVNCFVFISGWFGIHPSLKGITKLLFQIIFFNIIIYFSFIIIGYEKFSFLSFLKHSNFLVHWFIPNYIALYLLSPILNTFIDLGDKKTIRTVLLSFLLINILLGWVIDYVSFSHGYSVFFFMFIYLIARHLNKHENKISSIFNKWHYLFAYISFSFLTLILVYILYYILPQSKFDNYHLLFNYNSPIVLFASISLCLFFSRLNFNNRFVNWIAASSFAVYLFHTDFLILPTFFKEWCNRIFQDSNILIISMKMAVFVLIVYSLGTLLDQVRKYLWIHLMRFISK